MVSSLLAGIHAPLVDGREGLMPESLTRRANAADVSGGCPASFRNGVRLRVGTVSGFARNRVRHRLGIPVRLQSDFAPHLKGPWVVPALMSLKRSKRRPHNVG